MGVALQKTLTLVLFIAIGILLKKKIKNKQELHGIKSLILSIALPATIFIALLKIEINQSLILLPFIALLANIILFFGLKMIIKMLGVNSGTSKYKTLLLMLPSLAPGLSCFPFLTEYLGEQSLALAALADVGNKVFVLIILYAIAMHWYFKQVHKVNPYIEAKNSKLNKLLKSLISEPINMVLIIALTMLCLGMNVDSLPLFMQNTIVRLGMMMTPLVLMFIGIAVKINKKDFVEIFQILFCRSALSFGLSAVSLVLAPGGISTSLLLVLVVFPQSAVSFWPFAHMTAVSKLEEGTELKPTFDLNLGINLLAISLPFSTALILTICSTGEYFTNPITLVVIGAVFLVIAIVPNFFKGLPKVTSSENDIKWISQLEKRRD